MDSTPSRWHERRAAESKAECTSSFHGLGMNFEAMTTRSARARIGREQAADDALALAAAVDLGRVEEHDTGLDAGLPRVVDGRLGERLVVAAHAPGALVAPGPGPDAKGWDGDVRAGQRDAVARLRRRAGASVTTRPLLGGPRQVGLDRRPPCVGMGELR